MEESIYSVTASIIKFLNKDLKSSYTKALLAELRNSMNHLNNYSGIVWQLLFEWLPKDFLNKCKNGQFTKEEKVILSTLQLYAIHQQGNDTSVNLDENEHITDAGHFTIQFDSSKFFLDIKTSADSKFTNHRALKDSTKLVDYINDWIAKLEKNPTYKSEYPVNFGGSLNNYRFMQNDKTAIDRRFNKMLSSSTYDELLNDLRHLIKIVKAKSVIEINYPNLAKDLYTFIGSEEDKQRVQLMWAQSYYYKNNNEENSDE